MLGDAGANALGAALGAAAAARAPRPVRLALLGGVVGLTLLSERVSFSKAIDRVPALRRLDRWGRLDPDLPGAATESAANAEAEPADAAANGTRTEAAAPGPDGVRGRGAAEDDPTGVPRARRSAASPAPG
ncbi:hypothetical protein GCM10009642_67860 [Nocardiopsis metallicus]